MGHFIFNSILVGIFCCVAMDIWQRILFLIFNIPPTNWSTAGRWFIMLINNKIIINENLDNETRNVISMPLRNARKIFEKNYLQKQLLRFKGNIKRTSSFVGMDRSALHRKLKLLGVKDLN